MKGLLIKDFKIMALQKNFFVLIFAIVLGMTILNEDVAFPLCFFSFIMSLFVLTTISYDDFDNGYPFLFTLPITRKMYVKEKYLLATLLGGGSWLFSIILAAMVSTVKASLPISDLIMIACLILPFIILMQAVMIPFQLKYGGEKGRIAMIGTFGALGVIGIIMVKGAKSLFNIDLINVFNTLSTLNMSVLILIALIFALICLFVSLKVSITIMKCKEL